MVTAIVLINADRAQIKEVSQQLVDMSEVTEVFSVAGRYDLIAIVRVKTTEEVADTITEKIGTLEGITSTETLIAFRTYSRHDLEHMFSLGV
ncbi:MAG: Lrp/AsnC family transcriptional regulator [bacterium]|jgi:DNA-binding Lrp family transcriptional regulator